MPRESNTGKQIKQSVSPKSEDRPSSLKSDELKTALVDRPPVVCFLGHVDHGKTSLLDHIRKTRLQKKEAGGITQSIGAYHVEGITFIDTPGHEAFTAMRARGGQTADIAILVVAADDGVKPQTIEALDHIKAAEVPMIVAINKMDLPAANPDRVKQQLAKQGILLEGWGGDVVNVECSAKTGQGIDELLEMTRLVAELEELKADPQAEPQGILIESQMDSRRGPMATVIVKQGTLNVGHFIVVEKTYGKIKAMWDWQGAVIREAGPGMPAEILGLKEVVNAGTTFIATGSEKEAQALTAAGSPKLTPATVSKAIDVTAEEKVKLLKLIVKANTTGALDAVHHALEHTSTPNTHITFIHEGLGEISEADVLLAESTGAFILGFKVKADPVAQQLIKQNDVPAKTYSIIYRLLEDTEKLISGKAREGELDRVGLAEVLKVFTLSDGTTVAGCRVKEGSISLHKKARIWRNKEQLAAGKITSLRHGKESTSKVNEGEECGIIVSPEVQFSVGDLIESVEEAKVNFSL